MQDDSTSNIMETLIRFMDGELSETEKAATQNRLQQDAALRERYQHLLAAKRAIRSQGLRQQVQSIQQEYLEEKKGEEKSAARVIRMKRSPALKKLLSVAAVVVFIVAGYGLFQYTSTTTQSVYDDAYIAYQLPVNRSNEKSADMDRLYNEKNYKAVVAAFDATSQKKQKDYFLAAQSYLQLNDAIRAIAAFQQVEELNVSSSKHYFEEETDYYLLLAYIKAGRIEAAQQKLDKILTNKNHLFYNKAKTISRTKLTMLKWKEQ